MKKQTHLYFGWSEGEYIFGIFFWWTIKGIVHMKKMQILQLITHPHVVLDTQDLHSYSEHKLRYFSWNPRAFWSCIDSNATDTLKAQKSS